jgi:serine/threonine protein kinase
MESPPLILCTDPKKQGANGCFIHVTQEIIDKLNSIKNMIIEYHGEGEHDVVRDNLPALEDGKGAKILLNTDGTQLKHEYNAYHSLLLRLNDNGLKLYTAYGDCKFYIIQLKKNIIVSQKAYSVIHLILNLDACARDIFEIYESINTRPNDCLTIACKLYNDIGPLLQIMHIYNITHGDIKLENILDCGDNYKLTDFASIRVNLTLDIIHKTCIKDPIGTIGYILPAILKYLLPDLTQFIKTGWKKEDHQLYCKQIEKENITAMRLNGNIALYNIVASYSADTYTGDISNILIKKTDEFAFACVLNMFMNKVEDRSSIEMQHLEKIITALLNPESLWLQYATFPYVFTASISGGTKEKKDNPVSTGIKIRFIKEGRENCRVIHERQNGRHTKVVKFDNKWLLLSSLKIVN